MHMHARTRAYTHTHLPVHYDRYEKCKKMRSCLIIHNNKIRVKYSEIQFLYKILKSPFQMFNFSIVIIVRVALYIISYTLRTKFKKKKKPPRSHV